jgi:NAD(P)-dependent dehydrogenase (short-subunit alcohol dehydrogenase family)
MAAADWPAGSRAAVVASASELTYRYVAARATRRLRPGMLDVLAFAQSAGMPIGIVSNTLCGRVPRETHVAWDIERYLSVSFFSGEQFTRRPYDGYKAYAQSKQALTIRTWGLAARCAAEGVTANTPAPGFVRTGFNDNAHGPRAAMIGLMARLFAVAPAKGARTPLWVASAPELDGVTGKSFGALKEQPAKFTDPGPIAELERLCDELAAATG